MARLETAEGFARRWRSDRAADNGRSMDEAEDVQRPGRRTGIGP
ncbi:hypothetical protein OJ996_25505 [Luteolibacter sp. GHJ8]|uniref:Uncharacterized protein n=1 Tax=Luteolibacter rhizosphaerae TaxID=2989719 RepID=A0ABT3GAU5_9BACT|nr:hypothetical protein [Luteolibacter rhizosphaerae]MCW1916971.1 hypothetical protein [Luteolibacter rhizosphaerae]